MKKLLLILFFSLLPTLSFSASPYITFNLLGTYPQDSKSNLGGKLEYKLGPGGTTSVGFVTDGRDRNFRGELELGYRTNDFSSVKGQVDLWSFMSNGFFDFSVSNVGKFTIGAGIGMADIRFRPKGIKSFNDTLFAYQGMIGWSIPVSEYDYLDIQYRYLGVPNIQQDILKFDYASHGVMVGFRMKL